MALEDFTTYTAGGAQIANVTITASKCDVDCTSADQAWVYDDKGAGHFGNSFEHHFKLTIRASEPEAYRMAAWAVANITGESVYSWIVLNREAVYIGPTNGSGTHRYFAIRETEDGDSDHTYGVFEPGVDEECYHKVVRSGAEGKTFTCYIYTGSVGGVLKDIITITLTDADQGYRYDYAVNAAASGTSQMFYDVEDLDLNEGAPPAGAAAQVIWVM